MLRAPRGQGKRRARRCARALHHPRTGVLERTTGGRRPCPGKWAAATGVSVPSISLASALRVFLARSGSTSPRPAHSSSRSSTGQWTTSPSSRPRDVPDDSTTIVLPGVCPGAVIASIPGPSGPLASQVVSRSWMGASKGCTRSLSGSAPNPAHRSGTSRWETRSLRPGRPSPRGRSAGG